MNDMKQIDDECFAAAETLVASVFAGASHRERIALVLDIATPIFNAVKAAIAKQAKGGASPLKAPAAPRKRRTKAELEAARQAAAANAAQGGSAPPAPRTTPPAPRPPAPIIPPPSGLAPSPFGSALPPTQ